MIRNRSLFTRILFAALAGVISTARMSYPVPAASGRAVTESVIDTTMTGSITIHKIISNDGYVSYADGTGRDITGQGTGLSGDGMAPLDKVIFSYRKIADLTEVAGDGSVGLYFENPDPGFMEAIAGWDWNAEANRTRIEGRTYYTTAQMEAALAAGNAAPGDAVSCTGETVLTDYLLACGTPMPATDQNGMTSVSGLPLGLYLVGETDISAHDGRADETRSFPDPVTGVNRHYKEGDLYLEDPNPEAPVVDTPAAPYFVVLPATNVSDYEGHAPGTVWIYDVDSWPKDQTLSVTKKIIDPDMAHSGTLRDYEDAQIGDRISMVIYADAPALLPALSVPEEDAEGQKTERTVVPAKTHQSYIISDEMTEGLCFDGVSRVAYGPKVNRPENASDFADFTDLVPGTDYKLTVTPHGTDAPVEGAGGSGSFAVELLSAGLRKLDGIRSLSQVVVFFDATLNRDAVIGAAFTETPDDPYALNENHPSLTWRNSNTLERTIGGNHVYNFTYALDLTKKGISAKNAATVGFTLVRRDTKSGGTSHLNDVRFTEEAPGIYHVYDEAHRDPVTNPEQKDLTSGTVREAALVLHPDEDGRLLIKGLDSDRYTFREISTESGKELLKSTFDVVLTAPDPLRNGQLLEASAEVAASSGVISTALSHDRGVAYLTVNNYKAVTLRTGGNGRRSIYLAGISLLILTAGGIVLERRRRKRRAA